MGMYPIWLTLIGLVLSQACVPDIADDERRDCFPWVDGSKAVCEARGCVWCESQTPGVPWCYYNDKVCPSTIPEGSRTDCLPEGGLQPECLAKSCVWCESTTQDVPWCFHDDSVSQGGAFCPSDIAETERIDCHPEPNADKKTCVARGCHWCQTDTPGAPWCFSPKKRGYRMQGQPVRTLKGYQVRLARINTASWFGGDMATVQMDVEFHTENRLRIKFSVPGMDRFVVPVSIDSPSNRAPTTKYDVTFSDDPVFNFKVTRKSTGATIFDTSVGGFHFADQFIQIASYLDNDSIYGFGEHERPSFKHDVNWKTWGMWARDQATTTSNLYGHQPFYLSLERNNNAHGVLFLNANAQDVTLMPHPALTYRTTGGILDMYIFMGPGPDQVIQQYTQAIGYPVMVPYWALGFQLCRWGYTNLDHMKNAVNRMRQYNIPHDIQYGDIDYMDNQRDFTIDPENFAGLPEYVQQLKADGTRFIIILDPAIANDQPQGSYPAFDEGQRLDVWVKEEDGTTNAAGEVWPGPTFFPDYSKSQTLVWWTEECRKFKERIDYVGLWIDMNEPANFISGRPSGCRFDRFNNPPFIPCIADRSLWEKTLCMDTQMALGSQYNTHSLYGWSMARQSLIAAREVFSGNRTIVFSRSTFPGAGQWSQHWLGDNFSRWANLRYSVIGMFDFNMFGFPYVGSDICGFIGITTEEMCLRWHQLGAFYPFSRSHNANGEPDQDPGMWPEVARVTRETLEIRYTLLPYLYTLFHFAHTTGSTVVRPLMFEFVQETATHSINDQLLWGGGFLINPVLDEGIREILVYFPDAKWYSYYDGAEVGTRMMSAPVSAPLDCIPLYVRGGFILPTQNPANSTMFSRNNPMGLIAALDDNNQASGSLFWDDGDKLDTQVSGDYFFAEYSVIGSTLTSSVRSNGYAGIAQLNMDNIRLFGINRMINRVTINGADHDDWQHNATTMVLRITSMGIPVNSDFFIDWYPK